MKVEEVMSRKPVTIDANDLVGLAAETMVWGMISDRDVRQAIGSPYRLVADAVLPDAVMSLHVGAVMSEAPVTVGGDAHLGELARLFAERRIGVVPVVDAGGRLLGIISYIDVLRALATEGRSKE
jgi:acetoin utilization protein AcuB